MRLRKGVVGAHRRARDINLGPENALEALRLLGGGAFVPVLWGTFALAVHAWDQPVETPLRLAPTPSRHFDVCAFHACRSRSNYGLIRQRGPVAPNDPYQGRSNALAAAFSLR